MSIWSPNPGACRPPWSLRGGRRLLPALLALALCACGGGGGGGGAGADGAGDDGPAATRATALGSSADTVSLGWEPVDGSGGYRVERESAAGGWVPVAELPAPASVFVDRGLEAGHRYRYRLLARTSGQELARAEATTGTDAAVRSAVGPVHDELQRATLGPAGGRIATADGLLAVDVPAGAFDAPTELVLRRVTNTAPGGLGDGVLLAMAAAPNRPLGLSMAGGQGDASAGTTAIALQQDDGSWLSLPTGARTEAAVRATLPVGPMSGTAAAGAAGAAAPAVASWVEARVVRYEQLYLSPRTASVPVGGQVVLTPYARTLVENSECFQTESGPLCVPALVLEAKAVPLLNTKAGYTRDWRVEDVVGGTPALGTVVAPPGGSGAFYLAPARPPSPNPVTVSFHSTHQATGRSLVLGSTVEVREPYWTGTAQGTLGAADLAFTFTSDAIWSLSADGEADRYTASGSQLLTVVDINCHASATPSTAPLPPGALKIDRSSDPATYTLDVGGLWNTVITGTCPGNPGQVSVPMTVPGRLQVSGTVSADGRRIAGQATLNNIQWAWSLQRHD